MTASEAKDKPKQAKKKNEKPSAEEIERLRAERQLKKALEPPKPVTSSQPYIQRWVALVWLVNVS